MRKAMATGILLGIFVFVSYLPAQLCFRGKTRPGCSWFLITEFGALAKISQRSAGPYHQIITWECGLMRNLDEGNALGAALYASFSRQSEVYGGFKLRYRRWLGQSWSLESGAGLAWRLNYPESGTHITGHIGLNYKDYVILTGQIDYMEEAVAYLGIRTGALPGAVAVLVSAAALGVRYLLSRISS